MSPAVSNMVACMPPGSPELALSPEALAIIESTVTKEFVENLTYYALQKLSQKWWRGVWNGKIPGGVQAQDIAASALEALMIADPAKGSREWNRERYPNLIDFLRSVVDSKVNHLVEGLENRMEQEPTPNPDETISDFIDRKREQRTLPEEANARTKEEQEAANEKLFFALHEEVKDDPLLPRILECQLDGVHKRADIATKLGVEPIEVTQAAKRLERRLVKFREKYSHMNPFKD